MTQQESINYVRPEFYTGAEALADWISTGSCPLKYLDISWNTIRLDSAVYFGNAVACEDHFCCCHHELCCRRRCCCCYQCCTTTTNDAKPGSPALHQAFKVHTLFSTSLKTPLSPQTSPIQTIASAALALSICPRPCVVAHLILRHWADATDLKELDLSFNCFGEKGGEAIGASLNVNTSLKVSLRLTDTLVFVRPDIHFR